MKAVIDEQLCLIQTQLFSSEGGMNGTLFRLHVME